MGYFPSKKDHWLAVVVWSVVLLPVLVLALFFFSPPNPEERLVSILTTMVPLTPAAVLVAWMWRSTGYAVTDRFLLVRSGPFRIQIPLHQIRLVRRSRSWLASFSLSLDRLEIRYGRFGSFVLISPQDRDTFVALLRERCPEARFEL